MPGSCFECVVNVKTILLYLVDSAAVTKGQCGEGRVVVVVSVDVHLQVSTWCGTNRRRVFRSICYLQWVRSQLEVRQYFWDFVVWRLFS